MSIRSVVSMGLIAALSGCTSKPLAVGVRYDPPPGYSLVTDAPDRATFSGGLFIAKATGTDPDAVAQAALGSGWTQTSKRDGTLPLGRVVRMELDHGDQMALVYFAPDAHLALGLTADSSRFGTQEARVEESLARLRPAR